MTWSGFKYDASENALDISSNNLVIYDHVEFRNNDNIRFKGTYNSLKSKKQFYLYILKKGIFL